MKGSAHMMDCSTDFNCKSVWAGMQNGCRSLEPEKNGELPASWGVAEWFFLGI